jgi:hypothetical protein
MFDQIMSTARNVGSALTNGIPQQINPQTQAVIKPAISAANLQTALGPANMALIQGAIAVLNGKATATPIVPAPVTPAG